MLRTSPSQTTSLAVTDPHTAGVCRRWPGGSSTAAALAVLLLCVIHLLAPGVLASQGAEVANGSTTRSTAQASPLLPQGHWALAAVGRARALGLIHSHPSPQRAMTRTAAREALHAADARARAAAPEWVEATTSWLDRLVEEFPENSDRRTHHFLPQPQFLGGGAALVYGAVMGGAKAGTGYRPHARRPRTGAAPVPDRGEAALRAYLAALPHPTVAVVAEANHSSHGISLTSWDVRAALGPFAAAVGRQPVAYGEAAGGGMVLSGSAAVLRAEVETARPIRVPVVSRVLGPLSTHLFITRMREERHPGDPYLGGINVAIQPHPRLQLAARRAAVFGGDSVGASVSVGTVSRMIAGMTVTNSTNGFENQIASFEFRYRLPTERQVPLTVYGEIGMEDMSLTRAFYLAPGITVGLLAPTLPTMPSVSAGMELTHFGPAPGEYGIWYRHFKLHGGWATENGPLGHSLGGHGQELRGYGSTEVLRGQVRVSGAAFARHRGEENLYSPERGGISTGIAAHTAWRVFHRGEIRASVCREVSKAWREQRFDVGSTIFF
jgi:hypothetical protein